MFNGRVLISALTLCLQFNLTAAAQSDTLKISQLVPQQAVKLSLLHFIALYSTIQVSYEQKIKNLLTGQLEFGYVFENRMNPARLDKSGYKFKAEVRRYFSLSKDGNALYGAFELYHNGVNYKREHWSEECYDLNCTSRYNKRYFYNFRYEENGFALKYGFVKYFSDFIIDFNSGLALRYIDYTKPDEFPNNFSPPGRLNVQNEQDRVLLSPAIGVRIGYRIQ